MTVDLRSDTVTRPSEAMRKAMAESLVGDDVIDTDPTILELQALTAELLGKEPEWLLVYPLDEPAALMQAVDLVRYLQDTDAESALDSPVDLMAIPGRRLEVAAVNLQANLQEALEILDRKGVDALYVERMALPGVRRIFGVLTRHSVETAYRF